ncbi:pectinesterase/pectinesterase inhibitor PPE8B-like protein [Tanacetum coccineum]
MWPHSWPWKVQAAGVGALQAPHKHVSANGTQMADGLKTGVPWITCKQEDGPEPMAGVYEEYVMLGKEVWDITIFSGGINQTIITGSGFLARDITFQNAAGAALRQAVAFSSSSDKSVLKATKTHFIPLCINNSTKNAKSMELNEDSIIQQSGSSSNLLILWWLRSCEKKFNRIEIFSYGQELSLVVATTWAIANMMFNLVEGDSVRQGWYGWCWISVGEGGEAWLEVAMGEFSFEGAFQGDGGLGIGVGVLTSSTLDELQ